MRQLVRVLLLVTATSLALGSCVPRERSAPEPQSRSGVLVPSRGEAAAHVPGKVIAVYEHVLRTGHAPRGFVGGRIFENRERRLRSGGNYHEFDVNPKVSSRSRGPERLVVDLDTGQGWYSADHYRTFVPIEWRARDR